MLVVYVAGKFRGLTAWAVHEHCFAAEQVAMQVAQLGAMPLCPHMNTRNFDGTLWDDFWLQGTLELLRRCDAVLTVDNWKDSRGAVAEVQEADDLGIPVFHDADDLRVWLDDRGRR